VGKLGGIGGKVNLGQLQRWIGRSKRAGLLFPCLLGLGCCRCLEPGPIPYPPAPAVVCPPPPKASPGSTKPGSATEALAGADQPIDLLSALRLADAQNPEIAVARERIREALAQQEQADLLWLPNLELGPEWTRHDGQIQKTEGNVITSSRSALFAAGGAALWLELGDAIYAPLAARQVTAARQAGAAGLANERTLDVALAYTDLLQIYAEQRVSEETLENAKRLLELTESYERSGRGAAADTARARTEMNVRLREHIELAARASVASARLAGLLRLPADVLLRPAEPALMPLALVPDEARLQELIVQGLTNRPELAENRALIGAALERWRAAKVAPLLPKLRLAYAGGVFGGGPNSFMGDFDGRSDFGAMAVWEFKNFGFGDAAIAEERHSQFAQAAFRQDAIEARVAEQIVSAFRQSAATHQELDAAQQTVKAAAESYRLNEERIRRAPEQGRPIELLQALQALARARQDYVQVVADFNRAQFRLYTALGNPPLCSLETARKLSLSEPIVPAPTKPGGGVRPQ
jgi:outer membrane protein TolC